MDLAVDMEYESSSMINLAGITGYEHLSLWNKIKLLFKKNDLCLKTRAYTKIINNFEINVKKTAVKLNVENVLQSNFQFFF